MSVFPRSRRLACFFFEFSLALVVISRNSNGKRLKLKPTGAITDFFSFVTQLKMAQLFFVANVSSPPFFRIWRALKLTEHH